MDRRLLKHYNNELAHLRQMGSEFAEAFPKIAGRLSLDREAKEICPDPFVERLLEGFSFLTARIQVKLEAEFPRFTQALLETVYPSYLCPTPSMTVVRFEPDREAAQLAEGFVIPRGTTLKSIIGRDEHTACQYRTAHEVKLLPLRITEAGYFTRNLSELNLPPDATGRAAFRIRIESAGDMPLNKIAPEKLAFFVRGGDEVPVSIYEQIFSKGSAVLVRGVVDGRDKPTTVLPRSSIRRVGFGDDEALLPQSPQGFSGYRLLHEYFACPQRFLFFEVAGLGEAVRTLDCKAMDIIIPLREEEVRLENRVDDSTFELFCSPAINLFPRRADRVPITDRTPEVHVVVDRTRPLDFEVYQVQEVTGFGSRPEDAETFHPFYRTRELDLGASAFYTVNRVPRVLSERERRFGEGTTYAGSEVYVSLVDSSDAPYRGDLQQLGVSVLCTNRHLPIQMAIGSANTDFDLEMHAPVASVRCMVAPTLPRPQFAEGERAWNIINHLSLNYLSLLDDPEEGAVALRDILRLYAAPDDPNLRKQIDGVRSTRAVPVVRRVQTPGPIAFARGLEVSIDFDETAFEGTGVFLLGAVIEQFLARYVSLNSFTETVIRTQQRGEIMRWPTRLGSRHLI